MHDGKHVRREDGSSKLWVRYLVWLLVDRSTVPARLRTLTVNVEYTWWRHQMEIFSGLLALCARNSPATGECPSQRPLTRSFDAFFVLRLSKRVNNPGAGNLGRHCVHYDVTVIVYLFEYSNSIWNLTSCSTSPLPYPQSISKAIM